MTQIVVNIDHVVQHISRVLEAKKRLAFVHQYLSTPQNNPDLNRFLKFAQAEYTKKIAIEWQLYKLTLQELYPELHQSPHASLISALKNLPNTINISHCTGEVKTAVEILKTLPTQDISLDTRYRFLFKNCDKIYLRTINAYDDVGVFIYQHLRFLYDFFVCMSKLCAYFFHGLNNLISHMRAAMLRMGIVFSALSFVLIASIIGFTAGLDTLRLVCIIIYLSAGIYAIAPTISGIYNQYFKSAFDFQPKPLPDMDTIILDFGCVKQLPYASSKLQDEHARGLQSMGVVNKSVVKDFESIALMRYQPFLVLKFLKSNLAISDILEFMLGLPPEAFFDNHLDRLIIGIIEEYHGGDGHRAIQQAIDAHEAAHASQCFSLACIYRSGLFGIQKNRDKALQAFKKITSRDDHYFDARLELSHIMMQEDWQSAYDHCNLAHQLATTSSDKERADDLKEVLYGLKTETMTARILSKVCMKAETSTVTLSRSYS